MFIHTHTQHIHAPDAALDPQPKGVICVVGRWINRVPFRTLGSIWEWLSEDENIVVT